MREENQLKIICRIIDHYKPNQPFSRHLKDFFKTHPQMGSRDRRLASAFSYNYFRLGKALYDLRMIERLTIGNFLCSTVSNPLLGYCLEKFSLLKEEDVSCSLEEKSVKINQHYSQFNMEKIFPFANHVSDHINKKKFIESFLQQPKLWIRIRKGFLDEVNQELRTRNFSFEADETNPLSVSLQNATSLEKTDSFMKGAFEIQDLSSQQTINFIQPQPNESWWDACAGSGGKSLMIVDAEPTIKIFATDNRASILKNLEDRFQKASVKNFKTMLLDLASPVSELPAYAREGRASAGEPNFQFAIPAYAREGRASAGEPNPQSAILLDVPCTGSGTWARTPEWLAMFDENSIGQYVTLQRNIIKNLSGMMKPGMPFVYITCSVFKEENELNAEWIDANTNLSLQKSGYIEGFQKGADTMFAARFIMA